MNYKQFSSPTTKMVIFPANEFGFNKMMEPLSITYGVDVRLFLNDVFPGKWIGKRGPIEWPARSPDLSPLDFYFGVI
ncbi:hypothetical protein NQ315_006720 [Exocentrus adspersus]|uniref:Uncharacterized protein n=1 Tax=Exocentrus adspersus TaxID=1586481 RepID=A0AAV8WBM3_9CUCU|nr:hypothetical protein NQ315_006720 [Exocentrus adspersus]